MKNKSDLLLFLGLLFSLLEKPLEYCGLNFLNGDLINSSNIALNQGQISAVFVEIWTKTQKCPEPQTFHTLTKTCLQPRTEPGLKQV